MSSGFTDPNNHVPQVAPGDDWDDAEPTSEARAQSPTVLPPRRTATETSVKAVDAPSAVGLRIDPDITRNPEDGELHRLEVQEIAPDVVRLEQEVAKPLKVPGKVHFQERPTRESAASRQGEAKEWGTTSRQSTRWLLGAGGLILVIIVIALWNRPSSDDSTGRTAAGTTGSSQAEDPGTETFNDLLFKQTEALQLFRSYARAVHVDQIIPMVRDGHAIRELLAANWKPIGASSLWSPNSDSRWLISEYDQQSCGILESELPDHSNYSVYFVSQGGKFLLDWKATSGFGTATFLQLEKAEGDPSEIRGTLSPGDFYSNVWPEADYRSYRFLSPDGEHALWCYARRGSLEDEATSKLFQGGEIVKESGSPRKVTLNLARGPEGALPNQWLIREMLHIDWAAP